jgi:hypothetical protein
MVETINQDKMPVKLAYDPVDQQYSSEQVSRG